MAWSTSRRPSGFKSARLKSNSGPRRVSILVPGAGGGGGGAASGGGGASSTGSQRRCPSTAPRTPPVANPTPRPQRALLDARVLRDLARAVAAAEAAERRPGEAAPDRAVAPAPLAHRAASAAHGERCQQAHGRRSSRHDPSFADRRLTGVKRATR